jgi:molecular chaperone GrpE
VGQFIALRHEVNLQTKASRTLVDQKGESLRQLGDSLEMLRDWQSRQEQARAQTTEEALLPVLKVLVDLYDALALARREAQRVQESVLPLLPDLLDAFTPPGSPAGTPELPPLVLPPLPSWARRVGLFPPDSQALEGWRRQVAEAVARVVSEARERDLGVWEGRQNEAALALVRVDQMLEGLSTGYAMSLQRLERALQQQGLEPIPTVGETFDPERMEVLEATTGTGRPVGEVLEEVRRGYLWRGRVFRYAQVRVARS